MKARRAMALNRCHQKIGYMETLLLTLHSRTTDEWVKERIEAEFLGDAADRRFVTAQRRPLNGIARQLARAKNGQFATSEETANGST